MEILYIYIFKVLSETLYNMNSCLDNNFHKQFVLIQNSSR